MAGESEAGGLRQVQDVAAGEAGPLRIGLFTNNYRPMLGGVSTAVETVRTTLERLGHQAIVVAPRLPGQGAAGPGVIEVPAVPAPTYPDFGLPLPVFPDLARQLRALALDVFHSQHPFLLGGTARRLARQVDRPLVFTYHTMYDKYAHYVPLPPTVVARSALAWSRRYANAADVVIAPSEALARRLRTQGVHRPIEVLPTGIDLARFRPRDRRDARHETGLPPDPPLLLYVGRLDREKNLAFLLESFDRIAARHGSVRLVLVGRGTQEAALRELAGRLRAARRVHFVGGVPPERVVGYYQAANAFVFASTTETQGLAVLEAMAVGLPVVAVRASGVEEAVVDGVSGLLVPEDQDAFTGAVLALLQDAGLAAKLTAGAREGALPFSADLVGAQLVRIYRRALGCRRRT